MNEAQDSVIEINLEAELDKFASPCDTYHLRYDGSEALFNGLPVCAGCGHDKIAHETQRA